MMSAYSALDIVFQCYKITSGVFYSVKVNSEDRISKERMRRWGGVEEKRE